MVHGWGGLQGTVVEVCEWGLGAWRLALITSGAENTLGNDLKFEWKLSRPLDQVSE